MSDHSHFEELAALAAGGHLSDQELTDLQRHSETCAECKNAVAEFREVVHFGLPLAQSPFRRSLNMITSRPDPGARERFIRRASFEGIAFSPEVRRPTASLERRLTFAAVGAGILAATVTAVLFISHHLGVPSRQLDLLSQQNSTLQATISRLEQTSAEQQRETEALRTQVATLNTAASGYHHDNNQTQVDTTKLGSQGTPSLEGSEAQQKALEKLLEEARVELAGLKKARASDQASIVADQVRINELSDQLKTAKVNLGNMQRQLATVGGDVPNLMGARQLHVVDVRDSGPDGKPGKAFGRIFLTEGKSLVFYAFDLNDPARNGAKKTYQVWGQTEGRAGSVRSLGFLNVDNKTQQRWVLKTNDAATFKEVNSLFVTVEPQGGAKTPSGQRLLFAYLGEANHP
jgi:anti-sigma factor RsiW